MFTGEFATYQDVREFVEAAFGPIDDDSETLFLAFMGNALNQMWADLRSDPWYRKTWTLIHEVEEESFPLPSDLALVCSAVGTLTIADEDEDPEDEDTEDTVTTYEYELHYEDCWESSRCTPSGKTAAVLTVSDITPDPTPDTIEVVGYRLPSLDFFAVEAGEGDNPDCVVWGDIDLPYIYRSPFAKAVLGMMFFGAGDAPRGADWMNFANAEFMKLQKARPARTLSNTSAADLGIYQMGSRSILSISSCGCNVSLNWRLGL